MTHCQVLEVVTGQTSVAIRCGSASLPTDGGTKYNRRAVKRRLCIPAQRKRYAWLAEEVPRYRSRDRHLNFCIRCNRPRRISEACLDSQMIHQVSTPWRSSAHSERFPRSSVIRDNIGRHGLTDNRHTEANDSRHNVVRDLSPPA